MERENRRWLACCWPVGVPMFTCILSHPHTLSQYFGWCQLASNKEHSVCRVSGSLFPQHSQSLLPKLFLNPKCLLYLPYVSTWLMLVFIWLYWLPSRPPFKYASYLHVFTHTVTFRHGVLSQVCFTCSLLNKTEWLGLLAYQSINSFANQSGWTPII